MAYTFEISSSNFRYCGLLYNTSHIVLQLANGDQSPLDVTSIL